MSNVSREEVIKCAEERGWTCSIRSASGQWMCFSHKIYNFALQLWPDENKFKFTYNVMMYKFESGEASPFTDFKHYRKILRPMMSFCIDLSFTAEEIIERNKKN